MRSALALVLLIPCAAQVLPRQTVPGRHSGKPAPVNGEIGTVQVDAVAVDAEGRVATGLGVDDFEVLHDGRPQKVEKVRFVDTHERRTLVLIVDDLGLSVANLRHVRTALRQFIGEQLKPGDRVSILRTAGGTGALQRLTSDKDILSAAVDGLQYLPYSRSGASDELREQALAVGTLGTLRQAIDYLREEAGRKAVVLFSENLRERPLTSRSLALTTAFDDLDKMADVGSVVFYAIDPRGPVEEPAAVAGEAKKAPVISFSSLATRAPDLGLTVLARDTGGMIIDQSKDAAMGLSRVLQDQEGYYEISYRPDASSFTVATGDQRFENLAVRTARPGLTVRARNGLLPVSVKLEDAENLFSLDEGWRSRAIGSPFAGGDIRVRVTPVMVNSAQIGSHIDALLFVDVRDVTFERALNGTRNATLDLVLAACGELGSIDAQGTSTAGVHLQEAQYERAIQEGIVLSLRLQMRKPGAYRFMAAVRDDIGNRIGAASEFVEVPDLQRPDLAISSIYLQGDLADPSKTGLGAATKEPDENAAVRRFRAGAKFSFGYQIFNLLLDKDRRSAAELKSEILRDGVLMYTGALRTLTFDPAADPKRRNAIGSVTLAKDTAPGPYVLRITVTDKTAPEGSPRVVRQYADFTVRP